MCLSRHSSNSLVSVSGRKVGGFSMKHSAVSSERSRESHCHQRPHPPEVAWQNLPPPWSSVTDTQGANDLWGLPFHLLQLNEPFVLHKKFQTSEDNSHLSFLVSPASYVNQGLRILYKLCFPDPHRPGLFPLMRMFSECEAGMEDPAVKGGTAALALTDCGLTVAAPTSWFSLTLPTPVPPLTLKSWE